MIQLDENVRHSPNGDLGEEHRQQNCYLLLEIVGKCASKCHFCLIGGLKTQDPTRGKEKRFLIRSGKPEQTQMQLDGDKWTVWANFAKISAFPKHNRCRYVQLNINGSYLADEMCVQTLVKTGVLHAFLQFNGIIVDVYEKLHGRLLYHEKMRAIKNGFRYNMGVMLVPLLGPSINMHQIDIMINQAIQLSPTIRGAHFKHVSYPGCRLQLPTDERRFPLGELVSVMPKRTNGRIKDESLAPFCCNHLIRGSHGGFFVLLNGIKPLIRKKWTDCCCYVSADEHRAFIACRRKRPLQMSESTESNTFDGFLKRIKSHGFTIKATAFQNCYNRGLERLRQCSLHVYRSGEIIPFCANYLTCEE